MARDFPPGGVVYEPRSLWSARTFQTGDGAEKPVEEFTFNREHFRNGTRWPIELRRIAISPINYLFASGYDVATFGRDNDLNVINRMTVRVGVPFRQRYMREDFQLSSLCPKPTAAPQALADTPSADLWSIVRMTIDDDRPLYIPRTGTMETQLSHPGQLMHTGGASEDILPIPTTIIWNEEGGLFAGDARSKRVDLGFNGFVPALGGNNANNDTNENIPYGLPPPPFVAPAYGTSAITQFWSAQGRISGRDWDQQEATRSGSTRILGGAVGFQQFVHDDLTRTVPTFEEGKFAPMSTRVGSRIKLLNCGSGAWWWRPGAPLCLTFDTITPAIVYELPQPITVSPGDSLDVSITVPGETYGAQWGNLAGGGAAERYQFGISFNGYAAIES